MARIRKIEISHFRAIQEFSWLPSGGINCLIGPGDVGKSAILDAIDFCLGARRNIQFTDADFHALDVETPISISITLGELDDALKSLDAYGMYVGSFDAASGEIGDEPETGKETVLTMNLMVASDLEPSWTLVSQRAQAQGQTRNLNWADRVRLAPTRIGVMADYHLAWMQISEFPAGDFGSNRQAVSVETDRPFRSKAAPRCGGVSEPALANRRCVIHPILL